jgi:hypothetical protein
VSVELLPVAAMILARLLVPLAIPRYPLAGILGAVLLDSFDKDVYVAFTDITEMEYQHFDKALDAYYMMFVYLAMLRNWPNATAYKIGRFLWYYRLAGIAAFELTGTRWLLMLFPNACELFFILYEAVRLRWDVARLTRRWLVAAAGALFALNALLEFWIHILERDATDFLKEEVLGEPGDVAWLEVMAANLWLLPALAGLVVLLVLAAKVALRYLPPPDPSPVLDVDAEYGTEGALLEGRPRTLGPPSSRVLLEQLALASLMAVIFAEAPPASPVASGHFAIAAGLAVGANAAAARWLDRRGARWQAVPLELATTGSVTLGVVLAYSSLLALAGTSLDAANAALFVIVVTFAIALHDRYRALHWRRAGRVAAPDAAPVAR